MATDQCDFDAGGDLTSVSNGDAALGALGDNGGPTETIAIGLDSLAIDRVTSGCSPPATDQRGVTRPQGIRCDSGAFELEQRTLTVFLAGTGSGTVTGTGISCPGDCSQDYPIGSQVNLTAVPISGTFTSWSGGGCTGTAPCAVTMGTDTAVSAAFIAPRPRRRPRTRTRRPGRSARRASSGSRSRAGSSASARRRARSSVGVARARSA